MTARISPFLILGLDFGATVDEAEQAFSRRVRALRAAPKAPFDLEDLTWALNAIQKPAQDLSYSVEYVRIPAGRLDLAAGVPGDLFHPAPVPLERATPSLSEQDRRSMRSSAATKAMRQLLQIASSAPHDPYTTTDGAPR